MSPHKNGPQALLSSAPRPRYRTQQQALPRRLKNRRRGKVPAVSPRKNGLRGLPFLRPATTAPDAATSPAPPAQKPPPRESSGRVPAQEWAPGPSFPSPRDHGAGRSNKPCPAGSKTAAAGKFRPCPRARMGSGAFLSFAPRPRRRTQQQAPAQLRGHGLRLSPPGTSLRHRPPPPRRRTAIKFRLRSSSAPHDSPPPPSPLRLDVPLFRRHKKTGPRGSVRSVCLPQSGITPTRWWRAVSRRCRRLRG